MLLMAAIWLEILIVILCKEIKNAAAEYLVFQTPVGQCHESDLLSQPYPAPYDAQVIPLKKKLSFGPVRLLLINFQ